MRRWSRCSTLMLVAIAGCANTCGSERDGFAAAPSVTSTSAASPAPKLGADEPLTDARPAWRPAPDSEYTRRLRAAQTAIEQDRKFDELANEDELRGLLRAKLGDFVAVGEIDSAAPNDSAAPLVVVARNYQHGTATARVKTTDTGLLPSARHALSSHLALIGNEATGNEHAAFVSGVPTLLANFEAQHGSRATGLARQRFLIQITVQDATDPNTARQLLEHVLEGSGLGPEATDGPDPTQ